MQLTKVKAAKADAAKFMEDEITSVIKNFGKRAPGAEGEKQAVEYMAEQCRRFGCDDIKIESFELHPSAFMGWIYITVTLVLIACALTIAASVAAISVAASVALYALSVIFVTAGGVIMIGEFVLYRRLVDRLYPKKTSYNLTATKKPAGEIKRRILFNGHPDAACEWTFNNIGGGVLFVGHVLISIVGLLYLVAVCICALAGVTEDVVATMAWTTVAFVPFWVCLYVLWNEKQIVDGANDNLTGCYMGIAVLRALQAQGVELENTEVGVVISGAEEAGLRGAKAWCNAHVNDYKDCETIIVCYDTIHEGRFLQVNERDLNLTVAADKKAGDMFKSAADKLGITCNIGNVPLGATDSAAFNQGGFKAVGITAMNHNLQDYYHTRKDTVGNLDLQGLADCYEVSVQMLEDYENEAQKA